MGGTANGLEDFGTVESTLELEAFLGRLVGWNTAVIGLEVLDAWGETCCGFWNTICFAGETSGRVIFVGASIEASGLRATGVELGTDPLLAKYMISWVCCNHKC
jgi:hypothetical protein